MLFLESWKWYLVVQVHAETHLGTGVALIRRFWQTLGLYYCYCLVGLSWLGGTSKCFWVFVGSRLDDCFTIAWMIVRLECLVACCVVRLYV